MACHKDCCHQPLLLLLLLLLVCRWTDASPGELDWSAFMSAKREELMRINQGYRDGLAK
jgi:hypothetical protein